MKTLIAYFSHIGENLQDNEIVVLEKGNTEVVAEKIAELTGGDLYKIEEEDPYPFSYDDCLRRARREDENNEHPALKGGPRLNMDDYDTVYIGFPIWYRTYPRVVASFLDAYDFSGKTLRPFCTNDEGTFGISLLEMQGVLKGASFSDGLAIRGVKVYESDERIKAYIG
ncbi:MAG: flavodoxin [Erysipelotrichaceae bacterium]|nr:flavodoxin [Erysipelotrichaceae bacterium]